MTAKSTEEDDEEQIRKKLGVTELELKLTAAVYSRMGAATHVKETGKLPDSIGGLWNVIPMQLILKERGSNPTLTLDEQLVYDAIIRESRLPGGAVRLVAKQGVQN